MKGTNPFGKLGQKHAEGKKPYQKTREGSFLWFFSFPLLHLLALVFLHLHSSHTFGNMRAKLSLHQVCRNKGKLHLNFRARRDQHLFLLDIKMLMPSNHCISSRRDIGYLEKALSVGH